jgi:hypothetical protein
MPPTSARLRKPRHPINASLKSCSALSVSYAAEDEAYVPLPDWSVRSVHRDANLPHFWAAFASLQTTRSLCVAPLKWGPDVFSVRTVVNPRWRCPKIYHTHDHSTVSSVHEAGVVYCSTV